MKRTPFYERHAALGAKIVPFAGYEMAIQYAGIMEEHRKVRSAVGVFDVTHMGEFTVKGKNSLPFLQKVTVNDVSRLVPGRVQYSALCYEHGGIIDDLLVYNLAEDHYMLVVNASNMEKDFEWLKDHLIDGAEMTNDSDATALLAVQGPAAAATIQKLTPVNLSAIEYYHSVFGEVAAVPLLISRTGYTGELGFELYFSPDHALKIWDAIFDAGKEFGIAPIGLGARDTLRLEMGFCLYGNDIDETTHPLEAGLGWITRLNKGEFIGRAAMEKAKSEGLQRKLAGFTLDEKAVARHGYSIIGEGKQIGHVTSGTFSPSLEKAIGMGYVDIRHAAAGSKIKIDVRGTLKDATVVALPFYSKQ